MERTTMDDHLYSGLETETMKQLSCSLKFRPDWTYEPEIVTLSPGRVTVTFDGSAAQNINFRGCKIIRLQCVPPRDAKASVMPPILTIGGPCRYTKEDKRDFEIMMRTKQQSLAMKLPPHGEFDWPDYRSFEMCPVCSTRAKPGSNAKDRYWLIYQPLLQLAGTLGPNIGIRMQCRLVCEECFESMVDDQYVEARAGPGQDVRVPLLEAAEAQGFATFLQDGQLTAPDHDRANIMNAYDLYQFWEHTGTWQAMCNNFNDIFQESMRAADMFSFEFRSQKPADPGAFWEMSQIPVKEGRKCDGPDCANLHGNRMPQKPGKSKGRKIRLQECTGCFDTMYCSERCQHLHWPGHKEHCKAVQKKRKEEEKKKKAQEKMDEEARMEAALASFVPLSITPQGGGGKKKKGKKGGGKKKRGKK
ncbi:hypothetical protein ACHAXT_013130 [Thalassiosira profunda]